MTGPHRTGTQSRRDMRSLLFAALLLAAAASVAFDQPAASQQSSLAATGTEIAPRGQREVKDITYGDWKKLCFKPGGAKMLCRTSITGTFATGQMAVRLDIIEREGDDARRLQVFSPVGMYLQNPVKLTVDQGKPYRVPYTWCLTNACIAGSRRRPEDDQGNEFGTDAAAGIRGFEPAVAHDVAAAWPVRRPSTRARRRRCSNRTSTNEETDAALGRRRTRSFDRLR